MNVRIDRCDVVDVAAAVGDFDAIGVDGRHDVSPSIGVLTHDGTSFRACAPKRSLFIRRSSTIRVT